jgi:hypothetical protein
MFDFETSPSSSAALGVSELLSRGCKYEKVEAGRAFALDQSLVLGRQGYNCASTDPIYSSGHLVHKDNPKLG